MKINAIKIKTDGTLTILWVTRLEGAGYGKRE